MRILNMHTPDAQAFFDAFDARRESDSVAVDNSVRDILRDVRERGDIALTELTLRFDRAELTPEDFFVSEDEIQRAYTLVEPALLDTIRKARENIERFHKKQLEKDWILPGVSGANTGMLVRPVDSVGIYVPGGSAPLISTVLMNAVPASVAGVPQIIMATPPGENGVPAPAMLVAAREAGVNRILRIGGAQAIAALAYGTETVPCVDKITGPGNIYVATAKRMVFGRVGIDMIAGPSEVLVVADETAVPAFVAADLLSQAEHDPLASSVCVTTSMTMAEAVAGEVSRQLEGLPRNGIASRALQDFGAILVVRTLAEAVGVVNTIAPEHLELCVEDPWALVGDIRHAGAIFMGHYSPEPLGDYFAGPNHTLPTSGTARFFSPLNVSDFQKKTSLIHYSKHALQAVYQDVARFAEAESLSAHARSARVRFEEI